MISCSCDSVIVWLGDSVLVWLALGAEITEVFARESFTNIYYNTVYAIPLNIWIFYDTVLNELSKSENDIVTD